MDLFWALFGLIDTDVFEDCPSADCTSADSTVATVILALWLVVAVVILLNMLIALVTDAFSQVKVNFQSITNK